MRLSPEILIPESTLKARVDAMAGAIAADTPEGSELAAIALPPEVPIAGADLLVVEDILDTGRTLDALKARLLALGPRRLRVAVLLDKPHRRMVSITPDYVGFKAPDRWIVGYGLDAGGLYRNLPYISYVE